MSSATEGIDLSHRLFKRIECNLGAATSGMSGSCTSCSFPGPEHARGDMPSMALLAAACCCRKGRPSCHCCRHCCHCTDLHLRVRLLPQRRLALCQSLQIM